MTSRQAVSLTRKSSKRPPKGGQGFDLKSANSGLSRALVIHVDPKSRSDAGELRDPEARLAEAVGLSRAIDLEIAGTAIVPLAKPRPSTLLGTGKVAEIAEMVKADGAVLVIVNAHLSPIQQRNLEKAWEAKVLDRTGLILEIFGRRASTREGTLQVELAHLQYQKSRLVRSWTHLERQRGGFGFLGGPGESQLEADRRLIQDRISKIERDLASVVKTRSLHRAGRERHPYPVVALVGYTNAGKSTLFNKLTSSQVLAKDMLFATLDPTMRKVALPRGRQVILSDTVGFISELPTALIAAFRATLEEVMQATVILHVRDISHPETDAQAEDVDKVLRELGVTEDRRNAIVEVWNKSDLLDPLELAQRETSAGRKSNCFLVSAITGEGLGVLLQHVEEQLSAKSSVFRVSLKAGDGEGLAWLHARTEVLDVKHLDSGKSELVVRMDEAIKGLSRARFGSAMRKTQLQR
jgi:GTPase